MAGGWRAKASSVPNRVLEYSVAIILSLSCLRVGNFGGRGVGTGSGALFLLCMEYL